jgi:hypothetical protein
MKSIVNALSRRELKGGIKELKMVRKIAKQMIAARQRRIQEEYLALVVRQREQRFRRLFNERNSS